MYYDVTARLIEEESQELFARIKDGSIAEQKPDGAEIVATMKRAVVQNDDQIEWSEMCFCNTPLAHERLTVLDRYFTDIKAEAVGGYQEYEGAPLIGFLAKLSKP